MEGKKGGGVCLHSSPLFRLSNPAVTQPTNRMPSSQLCHLYLSESWRVNKDTSSTALLRLLVFLESECGRAEDGWGAESSSAVGLTAEKSHDGERQQGGDRNVMCQCGTLGRGRRGDLQEETVQRGKRSVHFSFARKKPQNGSDLRLRQISSCQCVPVTPAAPSSFSGAPLSSASPRFSNCDPTRWRANGGLGKAVGGRVVRVVALGAADFLQRQLCREETGNWFFWYRRGLHGTGGPKQTETRTFEATSTRVWE